MRTLLSAAVTSIMAIAMATSCKAFVPLTSKSPVDVTTTWIRPSKWDHCRKKSSRFLKSLDDVGGFPIDSIDQLESRVSAMKVAELRAELKSYGQSTNGLKKVLQERLLDIFHSKMANLEEVNKGYDDSILANSDDSEDMKDGTEDIEAGEDLETKISTEVKEKEVDDSNSDTYIVHSQGDESLSNSKQKWKKKIYLLMEDVRKLVHSKDAEIRQRAPKKAKDAVRRIQRWIASSSSTNFENDFDASYDDVVEIVDLDSNMEFRKYQISSLLRAYNLWIHALAKSGYDNAGYLAEQVLQEMQHNISNEGPSPDDVTIASVMDAHAHSASVSSSNSGAKAAETFLFELLEKHDDDTEEHDGGNALRDSLIVTCDTMLNAWAREGTTESAERTQLIVLRLEEYQRLNEKQRRKVKKGRRKSLSQQETMIESKGTRKRPISYATVMNAWANVGSVEAAEQAEVTLERLVERAKADRKENKNHDDERSTLVLVYPDTIVFNSVIRCWATSGDIRAGKKSLRLLEQMKELAGTSSSENNDNEKETFFLDTHPDIITYNTVLSAWSHCGKKNAAPQAEKIVKELVMEQQKSEEIESEHGKKNSVVANTITFNTVLHAWSKSKLPGATDRAGNLLEYMIQSDSSEIKPDVYSFTCVMDAWAKSKEPNKARQTRNLLDRLIEMRQEALKNRDKGMADALLPTQIPYNTVLNACAFSAMKTPREEKRDAIRIAVDTYKAMSSQKSSFGRNGKERPVSRDTVTYGLILKSIANLMPKGEVRSRMALQIFQECCDDGLVGFMVWNEVRRAVPIKLLQEAYLFERQCGSLEVKDLPKVWTSNCRERRSKNRNIRRKGKYDKDKSGGPSKRQPADTTFIIERSFATGQDV